MSKHSEYLAFLGEHELRKRASQRGLRSDVCDFIAQLTSEMDVQCVLEIGRAAGHSFGFFKFLWPQSYVVSIDINHAPVADEVAALFDSAFLFVDGDSSSLKNIDAMFDVVLIDGDHSYKGCKKDWINIQPNVHPGSIVLFDDLGHGDGCGEVFYGLPYHRKVMLSDNNKPYFGAVYIQ